jgi:hypothetical protein
MKLHWYAFCFGRGTGYASTYTGFTDKKMTVKRVNEAREYSKIGDDSVLISFSYMGYMTKQQLMED